METWEPSSQPIKYAEWLERGPLVERLVIHFWAEWNMIDRLVDAELAKVKELPTRDVEWRSFDIQEEASWSWLKQNQHYGLVPCVAGFEFGVEVGHLIGRRYAQEYQSTVSNWFSK